MVEFLDAEIWRDLTIIVSIFTNFFSVMMVEKLVKKHRVHVKILQDHIKMQDAANDGLKDACDNMLEKWRTLHAENQKLQLKVMILQQQT